MSGYYKEYVNNCLAFNLVKQKLFGAHNFN